MCPSDYAVLPKIRHTGFKDLLILFAGDIPGDVRADALAVPHLAQHAAIRRANALDRPIRAVRVFRHLHRGHAVDGAILRDDLAVGHQLLELRLAADEAPLAVGNRDLMDVADPPSTGI